MSPSAVGSTDRSLVRLVQSQEPDAWRKFVELYGPLVISWARRGGLSFDEASDVAQEVFLSAARAIGGFEYRDAGSSLRGWLWTITRNKTRDVQRRREAFEQPEGGTAMQRRMQELPESAPDESDPDESNQIQQLVRRGLSQVQGDFEPRTWQAFWRVVVDGRSTAEVAEQLGMSANLVRQCRSRVLRRLREHLGETG